MRRIKFGDIQVFTDHEESFKELVKVVKDILDYEYSLRKKSKRKNDRKC